MVFPPFICGVIFITDKSHGPLAGPFVACPDGRKPAVPSRSPSTRHGSDGTRILSPVPTTRRAETADTPRDALHHALPRDALQLVGSRSCSLGQATRASHLAHCRPAARDARAAPAPPTCTLWAYSSRRQQQRSAVASRVIAGWAPALRRVAERALNGRPSGPTASPLSVRTASPGRRRVPRCPPGTARQARQRPVPPQRIRAPGSEAHAAPHRAPLHSPCRLTPDACPPAQPLTPDACPLTRSPQPLTPVPCAPALLGLGRPARRHPSLRASAPPRPPRPRLGALHAAVSVTLSARTVTRSADHAQPYPSRAGIPAAGAAITAGCRRSVRLHGVASGAGRGRGARRTGGVLYGGEEGLDGAWRRFRSGESAHVYSRGPGDRRVRPVRIATSPPSRADTPPPTPYKDSCTHAAPRSNRAAEHPRLTWPDRVESRTARRLRRQPERLHNLPALPAPY